jgi:hypothetical protein
MRLAIAYSTKDQVELTEQTWPRISDSYYTDVYWCDASSDAGALKYFGGCERSFTHKATIKGGADAAIAWKLTRILENPAGYTHIGLIENDVLLDEDWLAPTLELFEKGKADGLDVGAVSPRSYVDRILMQRDSYAVMHNIGAGAIIFTRAAAEIVLRTFRTNWWPDSVRLFAKISGIDLRTYAAFRGNEQWITTDWSWEAQLARYGLASLALTPARCQMIGQVPPLAEQGLELTTTGGQVVSHGNDRQVFELYRDNLAAIRNGLRTVDGPGMIHRDGASMTIFPHQMGAIGGSWAGTTELKWNQGFGPFAYRAGPGGASLSLHTSGICAFLVTGGTAGARVTITDTRSGFRTSPELPAGDQPIAIQVPGGPIPRTITLDMAEGAVFYGLQIADPQMIDTTWKFDWHQLPEAT